MTSDLGTTPITHDVAAVVDIGEEDLECPDALSDALADHTPLGGGKPPRG